MILNQKYKILYIANPKTATTAVQKWLLSEDKSFKKGLQTIGGKEFFLKEHSTAEEAKEVLGVNYYDTLFVIGFIREPTRKIVSAYYFYKQGGKNKKLWDSDTIALSARIAQVFKFLSARILPLWLWSLVYPYKDNFSYFHDSNGKLIVGNVGRFEYLTEDLYSFFNKSNISLNFNNLQIVNKSSKPKNIGITPFVLKLLKLRHPMLKKDIEFYQRTELYFINENSD